MLSAHVSLTRFSCHSVADSPSASLLPGSRAELSGQAGAVTNLLHDAELGNNSNPLEQQSQRSLQFPWNLALCFRLFYRVSTQSVKPPSDAAAFCYQHGVTNVKPDSNVPVPSVRSAALSHVHQQILYHPAGRHGGMSCLSFFKQPDSCKPALSATRSRFKRLHRSRS